MPEHALALKPIAGPPAARAEPALGHARPVRALDETARRLNAGPASVAQRALAERLARGGPVQRMPKGNETGKRKRTNQKSSPNKIKKEVSEDEIGNAPRLDDSGSEHSEEEIVFEKPKRGRPKKRAVKKKLVRRGRPKKKQEIVESSSEEKEEERSESPKPRTTKAKQKEIEETLDSSSEDSEREESPVRKPKKEIKKKSEKDEVKMEDEYSDSEVEAPEDRQELAQIHGVVNYTKRSRKKGTAKVLNKVPKSGVNAAAGQLMAHAKQIQSKATGKSSGPTTITTALLLHKPTGIYKKFAFTNIGLMAAPLRREAESLGYHVVKAPETHAEGQLIQYLYVRDPVYGHHNMGVDKDHCAECQLLMQTYFGKDGYDTKAGKSKEIFTHYKSPSLLRLAVGKPEFGAITKFRTDDGGKNELARRYGKSDDESEESESSEREDSEKDEKKSSKREINKKKK